MKTFKTLLVIISLFLVSCQDFLQEEPSGFLSPSNFYRTGKDALAAINAAYDILGTQSLYFETSYLLFDLSTDQALIANRSSARKVEMDDFTFDATNINFPRFWEGSYVGINRANAVINRVPAITMNEELKNRIVGEAYFLRALHYFNLVRAFGAVPLKTEETTDLTDVYSADGSRVSQEQVYAQIISDLILAENVLPLSYPASEGGRATKGAAQSLLAKVYLTTQQWELAAQKAKQVIDSETYDLWEDYADVFKITNKNSKEDIFSIQFQGGGIGEGSLFSEFWAPLGSGLTPLGGQGDILAEPAFYASFQPDDYRKQVTFLTQYTNPRTGQTVTYPSPQLPAPACWKYFDATSTAWNQNNNNWPFLRFADVLLIYAEAVNETQGPTEEAYQAINRIRNRAQLDDLPEELNQSAFREAVYQERSWELAFEGHRWFDLQRTGRFLEVMQATGKPVGPRHQLYPVPATQIQLNPDLKQNEGY